MELDEELNRLYGNEKMGQITITPFRITVNVQSHHLDGLGPRKKVRYSKWEETDKSIGDSSGDSIRWSLFQNKYVVGRFCPSPLFGKLC